MEPEEKQKKQNGMFAAAAAVRCWMSTKSNASNCDLSRFRIVSHSIWNQIKLLLVYFWWMSCTPDIFLVMFGMKETLRLTQVEWRTRRAVEKRKSGRIDFIQFASYGCIYSSLIKLNVDQGNRLSTRFWMGFPFCVLLVLAARKYMACRSEPPMRRIHSTPRHYQRIYGVPSSSYRPNHLATIHIRKFLCHFLRCRVDLFIPLFFVWHRISDTCFHITSDAWPLINCNRSDEISLWNMNSEKWDQGAEKRTDKIRIRY